jgi:hypothetical protein
MRVLTMDALKEVLSEKLEFMHEWLEKGIITEYEYQLYKDAFESIERRAIFKSTKVADEMSENEEAI